jgi:tRNA threonylcarbamoyladenosine biosynthesis protein TsaE
MSLCIRARNESETRKIGCKLASALLPGDVIGLIGTLGAGKTTFTKGVADGLKVPSHVYVNSPTFTIVNDYPTTPRLIHFDFYRLSDADELVETGWDDAISGDAICIVEWFDTFPEAAPSEWLEVRLSIDGDARNLELMPHGQTWVKRLVIFEANKTLLP